MGVPSSLVCWNHQCHGRQRYVGTIFEPIERICYECDSCLHRVEIAPEELEEYVNDFATDDLKLILARVLARVTFGVDGVRIS